MILLHTHSQHTQNVLLINIKLCASGLCHQFFLTDTPLAENADKLVLQNFLYPRQSWKSVPCLPQKMKTVKRISIALSNFWIYKEAVRIFTV